jgi:hypothetical protein
LAIEYDIVGPEKKFLMLE